MRKTHIRFSEFVIESWLMTAPAFNELGLADFLTIGRRVRKRKHVYVLKMYWDRPHVRRRSNLEDTGCLGTSYGMMAGRTK